MEIKIKVPDCVVETVVNQATNIHGAGKLITKGDYTGADVYRADQDVMDTLDINNDGSIDMDDLSDLVDGIGDILSNFFS